jgi:hypothetical protein
MGDGVHQSSSSTSMPGRRGTVVLSASCRQQLQTETDPLKRRIWAVLAFTLEAVAAFALLQPISRPVWFIALFGFCIFAWGEIFALFPSITGHLSERAGPPPTFGLPPAAFLNHFCRWNSF